MPPSAPNKPNTHGREHGRKQGQITLFIIVGVVLLFIVIALFMIVPSLRQTSTQDSIQQAQGIPKEVEPVVNYLEACIDATAKEGLFLLGSQGGYLYENQGSLKTDYLEEQEGSFFLLYEGKRVPYRIQKSIGAPGCNVNPPGYPTINPTYPYSSATSSAKNYVKDGCFGKRIALDSRKSEALLKAYLEEHLSQNCPLTAFSAFTADSGTPEANLSIQSGRTVYEVAYPITLTNIQNGAKTSLERFRVTQAFTLERLYTFVNSLQRADINDPTYDIRSAEDEQFSVTLLEEMYSQDDIVIISSPFLTLGGEPFAFVFARRNRPPALEHITFLSSPVTFGSEVSWEQLVANRVAPVAGERALSAVDPDEDDLTLSIIIGDSVEIATLSLSPRSEPSLSAGPHTLTDADVVDGELPVTVVVSDGQFQDSQSTFLPVTYPSP